MDESERLWAGDFSSLSKAIAKAKCIMDHCLAEAYKEGMTAEEFNSSYIMFGEGPFIAGGPPESDFSAWDYAEARCKEICSGGKK